MGHGRWSGLCVLLVATTLAACGGQTAPSAPTPTPTVTPPPVSFDATGDNWDFRAAGWEDQPIILGTGYRPGGRISALNGAFDPSSTTVTAVMAVWGGCVNDQIARFTGTRNGLAIDMTAVTYGTPSSYEPTPAKVTIRVTGALSPDLRSFSGSYTADGGPCGTAPAIGVTGQRAELDGVWSNDDVTLTISLAAVPTREKGSFPLSGTVTFAGASCGSSGTVANGARGRLVFPNVTVGSLEYLFDAEVSPDQNQMRYVYWLASGSCPEKSHGEGTLTRR